MTAATCRSAAGLGALVVLALSGCGGVTVRELATHHVWERAICEAVSDDDRAIVREGVDEDLALAFALTPVPQPSIVALDPQGRPSPLADRVLVRERLRTNRIPVAETRVQVSLLVNGAPVEEAPVTLDELARRTGETLPRARHVVVHARTVGPGETLLRIGAGLITLGMSELLIGAVERRPGTYVEQPSSSEIAAGAPRAASIWRAAEAVDQGDRLHVWARPDPAAELALEVRITHVGRGPGPEPCELEERLRLNLGRGPLEAQLADRFGDREYTLEQLRAMAAGSARAQHRQ